MNLVTVIGISASFFTAIALLPQVIKLIREKKAEGLSYGMLIALFAGLTLWIYYGYLKEDRIIIISNSLSLGFNIVTTFLMLKYKK